MKQTAVEWFFRETLGITLELENKKISHRNWELHMVMLLEQAKEMEKEHMCDFADFVATYTDKNKNHEGDLLHAKSKYDGAERTIDLLEEYYNQNKLRKLVKSIDVKPMTKEEHESLRMNAYKPIK